MQHTVTDTVLDAWLRTRAGPRLRAPFELAIVPLYTERARARSPSVLSAIAWHEASPPHPGLVVALNRSHAAVDVAAGLLLSGGMSERAVSWPRILPARARLHVRVLPLEARWWGGQALSPAGRNPVLTTLVLQSVLSPSAVSASARTLLRSNLLSRLATQSGPWIADDAAGWLLQSGAGLVAAQLPKAAPYDRGRLGRGHVVVDHVDDALRLLPDGYALIDHILARMSA